MDNHIVFEAGFQGISFNSIDMNYADGIINKVRIEKLKDKVCITCYFAEKVKLDDAIARSSVVVEDILVKLVYHFDIETSQVKRTHTYVNGQGEVKAEVPGSCCIPKILTQREERELANVLSPTNRVNYHQVLYRQALGNRDCVAKFMFLYNILLQLCSDRQSLVDKYIEENSSKKMIFPSPVKQGVFETIFTRLRNEVGHVRANTYPEQTKNEIAAHVLELQEIVKKAISAHENV